MSQAKDRTLFTITKAHHPNWELDQMNNLFRGGRRELPSQRDPRIVPIRRRLTRIAPSPPPFFSNNRSLISTTNTSRTITLDSSSDDDTSRDTSNVSTVNVSSTRNGANSRTVRFRDYFLNSLEESESSDEEDDLLRLN